MYDLKNRKTFVRRVKVNGITLDNFYIGCTLYILGRLVKIVDFACENTRKLLHKDVQVTFVMIKPLPTSIVGKIVNHFFENDLRVTKIKKARLTAEDINTLYRSFIADPKFPFLLEHLNGQLVFGMELVGKDAVSNCLKIIGDPDPVKAEPGTIRALYGTDLVRNCVHTSSNPEAALQVILEIIGKQEGDRYNWNNVGDIGLIKGIPRYYVPKPGAKRYKKYDDQVIKQALDEIALTNNSLSAVAEKYNIAKSVLCRHKNREMKLHGRPTALTKDEAVIGVTH
ncbi:unnamed protein product [Parnassius apollo]|uniref:(apollo) hypothetical protein n=1 Tax=Parnassius apollo TaxID=110799 RepID=A0A8S3WT84_PARAO|nr:unnamed protein product [Parnassius apollo]